LNGANSKKPVEKAKDSTVIDNQGDKKKKGFFKRLFGKKESQ
jgi:hypothetical protein